VLIMSRKWTASDVPDQSGRVAIVTGSNTGIGYGAAAVLADKGAHVVLAVRNVDKGNDAKARITASSPNAVVTVQELDDAETTQVIRKQVKQRQDSIESFEKGGRPELAAKEKDELTILQAYLPQGLNADELAKIVGETISELGATSKAQMGAVMKALQEKVAGRADGKTLSQEVQRQLS
jgi:uncharacterized protein YqeY